MPKYRVLSSVPRGSFTEFTAEFVLDNGHSEIQKYVGADEKVLQEAALHMQAELDARSGSVLVERAEPVPFKDVSRVGGRIEVSEVLEQ